MSSRFEFESPGERIDAVLPQTQCRKCGYTGCRPYADAVASSAADINQCAPGGAAVIVDIAAILGVPTKLLDPRFGTHKAPSLAVIDEDRCIGCTLCIKACPVDAIVGAAKLMHTVIASACTGCELCVPPCPVDCIRMTPDTTGGRADRHAEADDARRRFERHNRRLQRENADALARLAAARAALAQKKKRKTIARALERARARLENGSG